MVKFIEKSLNVLAEEDRELDFEALSSFVQRNLFGIDIHRDALRVAAFSIYLKMFEKSD